MDEGFTVAGFRQYESTGTAAAAVVDVHDAKTGHAARIKRKGNIRRTSVSMAPNEVPRIDDLGKRHRQGFEIHDQGVHHSMQDRRIEGALHLLDAFVQRFFIITRQYRHRCLGQDRTFVEGGGRDVHGATSFFRSFFQGLAHCVPTFVERQQTWMGV
jgi:hypothetical protein